MISQLASVSLLQFSFFTILSVTFSYESVELMRTHEQECVRTSYVKQRRERSLVKEVRVEKETWL